jgi:hypothetical protein
MGAKKEAYNDERYQQGQRLASIKAIRPQVEHSFQTPPKVRSRGAVTSSS